MKTYDPSTTPDPKQWLDLDESDRLGLVTNHHQAAGIEIPNHQVHAAFHVIIENQLAENMQEVQDTLDRLMDDGLDRHDALHAIGTVVAENVHEVLSDSPSNNDVSDAYLKQLSGLTRETWLHSGRE